MANEYNEELLEPLKYYRDNLKDTFHQVTEDYFQGLVNQANVDIEGNRALIEKYNGVSQNRDQQHSSYKRFNLLKKVIFVIGIGALIYGIYLLLQEQWDIASLGICIAIIALAIVLYMFWIKPKLTNLQNILNDLDSTLSQMRQKGYEMMQPLNDLFHSEMTAELIKQSIPFIHLDSNFNIERYEQLVKDYGFLERNDSNHSTLDIASGDILGNPFVFMKRMIHWLGDYTYEGRRTVTYTVDYTDSKGERQTKQVSETLHATIKRPGPYYTNRISLIYGNHAAPNLTFSRTPPEKGFFNWGSAKSQLKSKISALRDKTKDSLKEGGKFQALANEEFDAQFNALDRDNEVEFRVLFTPLAQSNYKDIFENSPYGDDFTFNKRLKINEVETENSMQWNFETVPSNYYDFSFDAIQNKFITFNCDYFEHMYFSFLPLLAIPVYQQMTSEDYVYGRSYDFQYNDYITEMLANKLDIGFFIPPDAANRNNVKTMLKTSHYKRETDSEIIKVDAYSYKTHRHVENVPVMAGNGQMYNVPVEWDEYIPVTKEEYIEVAEIKDPGEDFKTIKELDHYQTSGNNRDGSFAYGNFMASKLYRDNQSLVDLLNDIYKQYGGTENG